MKGVSYVGVHREKNVLHRLLVICPVDGVVFNEYSKHGCWSGKKEPLLSAVIIRTYNRR